MSTYVGRIQLKWTWVPQTILLGLGGLVMAYNLIAGGGAQDIERVMAETHFEALATVLVACLFLTCIAISLFCVGLLCAGVLRRAMFEIDANGAKAVALWGSEKGIGWRELDRVSVVAEGGILQLVGKNPKGKQPGIQLLMYGQNRKEVLRVISTYRPDLIDPDIVPRK